MDDTKAVMAAAEETNAAADTIAAAKKMSRSLESAMQKKRAKNKLKWEKRIDNKLNKPGSRWANNRYWHDLDMINLGV